MFSKQATIDELKTKAENYLKMATKIEDLVPVGLPLEADIGAQLNYLTITLPYDLNLLRKTRAAFGNSWRFHHSFKSDDGRHFFVYFNKEDKTDLTICLRTNLKGSVCKLIQTGVKEVPVFDIICS